MQDKLTDKELAQVIAEIVRLTQLIQLTALDEQKDPEPCSQYEGILEEVRAQIARHETWVTRSIERKDRRSECLTERYELSLDMTRRLPRNAYVRVTSLGVEWCAWTAYRNGSAYLALCPWPDRQKHIAHPAGSNGDFITMPTYLYLDPVDLPIMQKAVPA